MRIAIMGVGAVGGLYGHRLAGAGNNVVFIARGESLERLQTQGLTLIEPDGRSETISVHAMSVAQLASEEPVDFVLLCVKAWQVTEAAEQLRPIVRTSGDRDAGDPAARPTGIATMQNGVEAPGQVEAALGANTVIAGATKVLCELDSPGVIRRVDFEPRVTLGELDNTRTARVRALADAMNLAGIETTIADDVQRALWEKFSFLVSYGGLCAVTRFSIGVVRSVPQTRAMLDAAVREIQSVGRALGVNLPDSHPDHILDFLDTVPENTTSSMMRDLLAGRPSELEAQNGAVVRLGIKAGVPTPVHSMIYATLLPGELAARNELSAKRFN